MDSYIEDEGILFKSLIRISKEWYEFVFTADYSI